MPWNELPALFSKAFRGSYLFKIEVIAKQNRVVAQTKALVLKKDNYKEMVEY